MTAARRTAATTRARRRYSPSRCPTTRRRPRPTIPAAGGNARAVNQATDYIYFRNGSILSAIDGHSGSPTFNTLAMQMTLGGPTQSFAIDAAHGVLYVVYQENTVAGNNLFQAQV